MSDEKDKNVKIDDLPRAESELTDDEAKDVKGGTFYGTGVYKSTDSGRTWTSGNTIGGTLSNDQLDPNRKMGDGSV